MSTASTETVTEPVASHNDMVDLFHVWYELCSEGDDFGLIYTLEGDYVIDKLYDGQITDENEFIPHFLGQIDLAYGHLSDLVAVVQEASLC